MFDNDIIAIERQLIASVLFDPSGFDEIRDNLRVDDFLHIAHQHIFSVCLELKSQSLPIALNFVSSRLIGEKFVSEEELLSIASADPIANIAGFIKEIKSYSTKRRISRLIGSMGKKLGDPSLHSDNILEEIEREIYEISQKGAQTDFQDSGSIVKQALQGIDEQKLNGNGYVTGLATKFHELDKVTTGFNQGELIIIGARPSMGKTALILQMAQAFLNKDNGVAIFSLEMKATDLMLRMLSSLTSLPFQDLRAGRLVDKELESLARNAEFMITRPLYIDDGSMLSIGQLRSKLRKLKASKPNVKVAIIDYLQLMCGSGKKDSIRHEEISEISRGLKTLARDLQMPIIALSQLNRMLENREDKRPILSDLRESGAIEQDADVILFLYRDFIYKRRALRAEISELERKDGENVKAKLKKKQDELRELEHTIIHDAEIIVAKNRNGETKDIKIQFNSQFMRFENKTWETEVEYKPFDIKNSEKNIEIVNI